MSTSPGPPATYKKTREFPAFPCLDIRQQCTGFLYGLQIADAFIKAGMYKRILLVGAEVHSSALNFTNEGRDVAVLFGDGAGAAIIGASDDQNRGLLTMHLHADGKYADILMLEIFNISKKPYITHKSLDEGRQFPKMVGREVFKVAVTRMPEVIREALQSAGFDLGDIKLFIPHQANMRINQFVAASLDLPEEKFSTTSSVTATLRPLPSRSRSKRPGTRASLRGRFGHACRLWRRVDLGCGDPALVRPPLKAQPLLSAMFFPPRAELSRPALKKAFSYAFKGGCRSSHLTNLPKRGSLE